MHGKCSVRERERNVLFNDALNTFYLRLYGVRHMVKDHSDSEKGNLQPSHRLLLSIGTGKRYLRVYIQIRFRHACHETRDRQRRSLVSGQEEGWGEVKVLLKF